MTHDRQLASAIGHVHDALTDLAYEVDDQVDDVRARLVSVYNDLTDMIDPLDDSREEDSDAYTDE